MKEKKAKILVCGSAGYIGGHLIRYLLEKDYDVVAMDNLSNGSKDNIPQGVTFFHMNTNQIDTLSPEDIDCCVNLAATLGYENEADPIKIYHNNISNFLPLLNWLEQKNIPLVNISSAAVDGGKPNTKYGLSKYIVEQILQQSPLPHVTLRLFNVYGRRWGVKRRTWSAIEDLAHHDPEKEWVIYGDGTTFRDYVHVLDVCNNILKAILYLTTDYKGPTTREVGSGLKTSYNTLLYEIELMRDIKFKRKYLKQTKGDIVGSVARISDGTSRIHFTKEDLFLDLKK